VQSLHGGTVRLRYRPRQPTAPTADRPRALQTTTDDADRRQRAKQYWPIRRANNKLCMRHVQCKFPSLESPHSSHTDHFSTLFSCDREFLYVTLPFEGYLDSAKMNQLRMTARIAFGEAEWRSVTLTGHNTIGPPWSVGRPTARAPGAARLPAVLQTTTDDDRRYRAKQYWPIRRASDKIIMTLFLLAQCFAKAIYIVAMCLSVCPSVRLHVYMRESLYTMF